jgi:lipoate-protein ligase A
MGKDLELFDAVRKGSESGFLRIYNWNAPAVTLGRHQDRFTLHDPRLVLPVLRRPTGGGAVLHMDDFTFSLAGPAPCVLPQDIRACRSLVSKVFSEALGACGVRAGAEGGSASFSQVCFAGSSQAELTCRGIKIMGLALARKRGFVLAQGVIPLRVDRRLTARVFGDEAGIGCAGLLEMHPDLDPRRLARLVKEGLASNLGISFCG